MTGNNLDCLQRKKQFLIRKVESAFKRKWPDRNHEIAMQQDGVSSNIEQEDPEFVAAATTGTGSIGHPASLISRHKPATPDILQGSAIYPVG
jgi:hypothetical protein